MHTLPSDTGERAISFWWPPPWLTILSFRSKCSRLVVRHTRAPNGWASLPPTLCARLLDAALPLPLALELRPLRQRAGISLPSDTPIYVAWDGASSGQPGVVGLAAALARALGLADGAAVAVRQLPQAPPASSVTVEPASEDDWEVVEMNAGFLEEQLLSQARCCRPCVSVAAPRLAASHDRRSLRACHSGGFRFGSLLILVVPFVRLALRNGNPRPPPHPCR